MTAVVTVAGREVLIDHADLAFVVGSKWAIREGYVVRRPDGARLHRILLDAQPDQVVDHIDGNPLNNRRANIRLCTQQQNLWNRRKFVPRSQGKPPSSQYHGVYRSSHKAHAKKPWLAYLSINGKRTYVGSFTTAVEAARAYDRKALETRGEFARLNFPAVPA